jgi:hypothetical protein
MTQVSLQSREAVEAVKLELSTSLGPREEAALRHPPMPDGRRDPLHKSADPFRLPPSDYSLEPEELAAEVRRLVRAGWRSWELALRLGPDWQCGGGR